MRLFTLGVLTIGALIAVACAKIVPDSSRTPVASNGHTPTAAACPARATAPTRYFRQLSLELRGRPPSFEELDAVARDGKVSDARIDALLQSDDFVAQAAVWHKPLLWPNVDNFAIGTRPLVASERQGDLFSPFSPDPEMLGANAAKHPHAVLSPAVGYAEALRGSQADCDDAVEYPAPAERGPQPTYTLVGHDKKPHVYAYYDAHGVPLPYHDGAHCPNLCSSKTDAQRSAPPASQELLVTMSEAGADAAPDDLDPPGKHCPASHPYRVINPCDNSWRSGPTSAFRRLHGYRSMVHYWSHGKALKTCAAAAQTREVGFLGEPCATTEGDPSCGCGPEGRWCLPAQNKYAEHAPSRAEHELRQAIDDEPLQIVKSVVARDEDYFNIFTTRRSFVTGPLSWFFRRQTPAATPLDIEPPAPPEVIPEVAYDDAQWHEYARGDEHAGVLTTAAYLIRFPTWRSRVSQFRTQMMCRPFTPSVAGFPGPGDACTVEPNLAKRCGCRNCHATIEPMSAWFGRWSERSVKYLDPAAYPAFDALCAEHPERDPAHCADYIVDALDGDTARYAGTLRAFLYRSPDEQKRIDEGPRGLVKEAIESGELESCTVKTTWAQLLGRPMTGDEESARLPALEGDFEAHHRSYRSLVHAIVTSPEAARSGDAGRTPKRLGADQLRTSLLAATGFTWVAPHRVSDPDAPRGTRDLPDADMIEVLAATLGRADYTSTTSDALDPAITFAKLSSDAARSVCRASVNADVALTDASKRRLLRFVGPADTATSNAEGVRRNLSYLALRFWGRSIAPDDPELVPLATLFARATEGATPPDGWRAVCIALATDPAFLTY